MTYVADASPSTPPTSPQLQATVQRAFSYAQEQGHRQVTPEHLLLALTEDADAIAVLQRRAIDLDRLRHDVAGLMGRNNDRFVAEDDSQPEYGADFRRIMGIASGAASPRRPIDGALMLSALIADGATPSAEIIRLYGLTFEDAARTTRPLRTVAPPAAPVAPLPPTPISLANVRSSAREAALGYRLRKGPPEELVAITAETPPHANGVQMRRQEPPPQTWPEHAQPGPAAADTRPGAWPRPLNDEIAELPPPVGEFSSDLRPPPWHPEQGGPEQHEQPDWSRYDYPDAGQDAQQQVASAWTDAPALSEPPPPQQQRPAPRNTRQFADPGATPKTKGRKSSGKARRAAPSAGILLENIPRRMVSRTAMIVEARVARRDIEAALLDLQDTGHQARTTEPVTHALTVRLRSTDGAMIVEPGSPETQWIESTLGLLQDDFSSWRWTVTPRWSGVTQVQLMLSARAVSSEGLLGETALSEQTISVEVASNYGSVFANLGKWIGIAMAAGVVGAVGEHMLKVVGRILTH